MIGLAAAAMLMATAPQQLHILFIGNSHTERNNLPSMVASLLESDGSHRKVETFSIFIEFLADGYNSEAIKKAIVLPKWDLVVLQAAKASSSHKFTYNNDGAAALARMALNAKSRALFFVEWPRRGWDESEFQMGVYKPIQTASKGSELVPVCYAWDSILKRDPNFDLWDPDGNHASLTGTFLASYVFYYYIAGENHTPTWVAPGVPASQVGMIRAAAKAAVDRTPKHPVLK